MKLLCIRCLQIYEKRNDFTASTVKYLFISKRSSPPTFNPKKNIYMLVEKTCGTSLNPKPLNGDMRITVNVMNK